MKSFAYVPKEGNVNATLGLFVYRTNFEGSNTGAVSPYLPGFGLVVTGDLSDRSALELSLFELHKSYFREKGGKFMGEKTETVHVAMGYRRWLGSTFSASLSFYSSYSLGEVTVIHDDFSPGFTIDTGARDKAEYGLDAALLGELWSGERIAATLEVRYSYSITARPGEKADTYGALLGLKYFVQEKQIRERRKDDLPTPPATQ